MHFCSFVHQVILREAWSQNVFFAWNLCNIQHPTNGATPEIFQIFELEIMIPTISYHYSRKLPCLILLISPYPSLSLVIEIGQASWWYWSFDLYGSVHDLDNVFWLVCHLMYLAISHGIACGTKITQVRWQKAKSLRLAKVAIARSSTCRRRERRKPSNNLPIRPINHHVMMMMKSLFDLRSFLTLFDRKFIPPLYKILPWNGCGTTSYNHSHIVLLHQYRVKKYGCYTITITLVPSIKLSPSVVLWPRLSAIG